MNSLFRIAPRVPVTAAAATRRFYATETAAASKPKVGAVRGG